MKFQASMKTVTTNVSTITIDNNQISIIKNPLQENKYLLLRWDVKGAGSSFSGQLVHQPDVSKCPSCHHSIIPSPGTIGVKFSRSQTEKSQ